MAIICKTCEKALYKDDGSGPYCCPSCVNRRVEAVDSTTGELVELKLNKGRKSVTPKGRDAVHLTLMKQSRYTALMPERVRQTKMLRLQSRQYKNTTVPLGPVYLRFDQNGVAEVEEHNKQFLDPILQARPGRFEWLESATEDLVDVLAALNQVKPEPEQPVVPEKVEAAEAVAAEAKTELTRIKKAKKKSAKKKIEE